MTSTTAAQREPIATAALIKELISSGVKLLIVLGIIVLTGEQVAVLLLFVDNFLALGAAIWARRNSTATAAPVLEANTKVTTPAGTAATVKIS